MLLLWSVVNGTLVPKASYTATTGAMVLPFVALAFQALDAERWRAAIVGAAAVATAGVVAISSCEPCMDSVGLWALLGTSPIPRFENQATADELARIVANLADPPRASSAISMATMAPPGCCCSRAPIRTASSWRPGVRTNPSTRKAWRPLPRRIGRGC